MDAIAVRCRTCDRPDGELAVRDGFVVLVCARCVNRTLVRCPACRRTLAGSSLELVRCTCGRSWALSFTMMREVDPTEAEPPPSDAHVQFREMRGEGEAGYRDHRRVDVLEVRRPARGGRKTFPVDSRWGCVALFGLTWLFTIISHWNDWPPAKVLIHTAVWASFVSLPLVLFVWRLRKAKAAQRRPADRIRVGPDALERWVSGRWTRVAPTQAITEVKNAEDGAGSFRVRVQLEKGERIDLVDALSEEEAAEVRARVREHVARHRG